MKHDIQFQLSYGKNLQMKEKLNKKEQHKLYIYYLRYTQVILLDKQSNSSTIADLSIYSAANSIWSSVMVIDRCITIVYIDN